MFYTFDDQLTTDQKLALLDEWLEGGSGVLAALAPGGEYPDATHHRQQVRHLETLRTWRRLVAVEQELAASQADRDDPDPLGDQMQEAWCRMTRLQLRLEGVHVARVNEEAKRRPSPARIERLRERIKALSEKLSLAQAQAETGAIAVAADAFADFECEGDGCTEGTPCTPCACRKALEAVGE